MREFAILLESESFGLLHPCETKRLALLSTLTELTSHFLNTLYRSPALKPPMK